LTAIPAAAARAGPDGGPWTQGIWSHEKITSYSQNTQDKTMDAERINLIGNTLFDLTVRTQELRRYL